MDNGYAAGDVIISSRDVLLGLKRTKRLMMLMHLEQLSRRRSCVLVFFYDLSLVYMIPYNLIYYNLYLSHTIYYHDVEIFFQKDFFFLEKCVARARKVQTIYIEKNV